MNIQECKEHLMISPHIDTTTREIIDWLIEQVESLESEKLAKISAAIDFAKISIPKTEQRQVRISNPLT